MPEKPPRITDEFERSQHRELGLTTDGADRRQSTDAFPDRRDAPALACADRRPATDRLRAPRTGFAGARQRSGAGGGEPRPDRPMVPGTGLSGPVPKRPLRRWSVAELIARSLLRPDDAW